MLSLADLNEKQRSAVATGAPAACVIAGPGTGKTRVLTYRAAYLVHERQAAPASILSVAFTNKAAEELHERLPALVGPRNGDVQVHTFHSYALRLLRDHGESIGLSPHFAVFDDVDQLDIIALAWEQQGLAPLPQQQLAYLRSRLSKYKNSFGRDPADEPDPAQIEPDLSAIAGAYRDLLRAYNAFDFDDLLIQAVRLLHEDEQTRRTIQESVAHLLVDEFHDLNLVQYELMRLIAPPGRQIMVVVDDNQSIYGWRGADPRLIGRFLHEYRPARFVLDMNYRSSESIVAAAQALLDQAGLAHKRSLMAVTGPGDPVEHHIFAKLDDEHRWLRRTIAALRAKGAPYKDIAILYRIHSLSDPLTAALLDPKAPIPVHRIQPDSFFDRPGARDVLCYLQFLLQETARQNNPRFVRAMNFPRVVADELTMLQLNDLAAQHGISLSELGRRIDQFPQVSPLTRSAVRHFVTLLDGFTPTKTDADAETVLRRLFAILETRRSPYRREDHETLRGFLSFLSLSTEVAQLRSALDAGRSIHVIMPPVFDALCAAVIIRHTAASYLNATADVHVVSPESATWPQATPENPFVIDLRAAPGPADLHLTTRSHPPISYSLSTLAWRLCQGLLMTYETLDQQRFVVYDLETTGKWPQGDEAVEVGACAVVEGKRAPGGFHSLLKPRQRFIGQEAQQIHGLTAADVASSPHLDQVAPDLLAFMGDSIVAGHNILGFDNIILDRALTLAGKARLPNRCVDTLLMARQLLPNRSHTLESLAGDLLRQPVQHRAASDAATEADLLIWLLQENRWHKELHALAEVLPLVAWGMRDAQSPIIQENELLYRAAGRVARSPAAQSITDQVLDLLPVESILEESASRAWLREGETATALEDAQWQQLQSDWLEQVRLFRRARRDHSLSAFLDYVALVTDDDTARADDCVTLMTLHNAKGKEFPVVFIIGLEDNIVPMLGTQDNDEELEEERRVLYVGMTRAKERLYLSSVLRRNAGPLRGPSRFVLGLPERNVKRFNHQ